MGTRRADRSFSVADIELRAVHTTRRRRTVFTRLVREGDRVGVDGLASDLADEADRIEGGERLAVFLHHVDLPKLADAGLVDYDSDARTAVATDRGTAVGQRLALESYYR